MEVAAATFTVRSSTVSAVCTTCVTAGEALAATFPWPEYTALRLSVPDGREEVTSVATPPVRVAGEPSSEEPFLNCTVPVGDAVPLDGVTVAVSVTGCAKSEGFGEEVITVDVAMHDGGSVTS